MARHTPGPWGYTLGQVMRITTPGGGAVAGVHRIGMTKNGDPKVWAANARLLSAAPELLAAQTMGAQVSTPDFLDWIADRLVEVHGENPNVDFVHSLRERAAAGRAAMVKALRG